MKGGGLEGKGCKGEGWCRVRSVRGEERVRKPRKSEEAETAASKTAFLKGQSHEIKV